MGRRDGYTALGAGAEPGCQQGYTTLLVWVCDGPKAPRAAMTNPKGPGGLNNMEMAKDTELVSGTSRSFPVEEPAEMCEYWSKGSPQGQNTTQSIRGWC